MSKILLILVGVLFVSVFSPQSFAGDDWYEKGNGGFALMCAGEPAQVFDLFEAKDRYEMKFDNSHRASLNERVQYLISKFDKHNPSRATLYREWFSQFMSEARFIENAKFNPLADIGFGYIPRNCRLEQIAYQRAPSILNNYRYILNKDIWDSLDVVNRAALVMHELIYRELTQAPNAHENSEATRYFNGFLNSSDFAQISYKKYVEVLQALRIMRADYGQVRILLGQKTIGGAWTNYDLEFYPGTEDKVARAIMDNIQNFEAGNLTFDSRCVSMEWADRGSVVDFFASGKIERILMVQGYPDLCSFPSYRYKNDETSVVLYGNRWRFNENGDVLAVAGDFQLSKDLTTSFVWNGQNIKLQTDAGDHVMYQFIFLADLKLYSVTYQASSCYDSQAKTVKLYDFTNNIELRIISKDSLSQEIPKLPICE